MGFKKWSILILTLHVICIAWFILSDGNAQRPDTERYLLLADKICHNAPYESRAERYRTGYFSPNDVVEDSYRGQENLQVNAPEIFRTPGYPAFLCALDKIGLDTEYEIVVGQLCVFYFCILCFYYMARRLYGAEVANPATLLMLVSPGGLVYSLTLYSEVLFLFFLVVAVLAFLIYLKEFSKRALLVSGVFFAVAFYVRAGVVYVPFLLSLLALMFSRQRFTTKATHMLLFIALFVGSISPWILRNYSHYGTFYISGQLSNTLAIWHLPDVWSITKGVDPNVSRDVIRTDIDKLVQQYEQDNKTYVNNVEFFTIQENYARENLKKDLPTYAKKWAIGMWYTSTGGYFERLYYLFLGKRLLPLNANAANTGYESKALRVIATVVQKPSEAILKILFHLERLLWISAIALALIPVISGAIRFDASAWVILAVVSYFIFIPGTMGYSRFRFAVDWLIILQAIIGANMAFNWLTTTVSYPKTNTEVDDSHDVNHRSCIKGE